MEVWQSARSVPVRRQKRLFDETKEAEKVFSDSLFFSNSSWFVPRISQILSHCPPNFASTIVMKYSCRPPTRVWKKKFFWGGGARVNRVNYGEILNEEFQTKEVK